MSRTFRRYHRQIAIALCLPLFLSAITGIGYTIANEWLKQADLAGLLLSIHTLEIFHLEAIYPLFNGLGLLGLLITGITMTGLFRQRPSERGKIGDS
jgi:hypothetical protein